MPDLVTKEEALEALRYDGESQAPQIGLMITAASEAIIAYLKQPEWLDADPLVVPARVKLATIALVGRYLRELDGDEDRDFSHGNLPDYVTAIIYPDRRPTLA